MNSVTESESAKIYEKMVTKTQNLKAFQKRDKGSSKYRCVSYCKQHKPNPWGVGIQCNSKTKRIGGFESEYLAAIAANIAMLMYGYDRQALNKIEPQSIL
jgi:hypothetical protein